jgi:sterol 24-C-methyltransferase
MEGRLLSTLDLPMAARVPDAGRGVAHVAIYMAGCGLKVEGIGIVDHHIARGRKNAKAEKLENSITMSKMSYQDLSFSDASFDSVHNMETLSHATNFPQAIKELHMVLRPGGSLALFKYEHADSTKGRAKEALRRVNEVGAMSAFQNLSIGSIEKELGAVGFEDIEVRDFSENVAPMMRFFALMALLSYMLICLQGLEERFPDTMAAVELWRHREYIKYVVVSAKKGGKAG